MGRRFKYWKVFLLCMISAAAVFYSINCYAGQAAPEMVNSVGEVPNLSEPVAVGESEPETEFHDKAERAMEEIYYKAVEAALGDGESGGKSFVDWVSDSCYHAYKAVAKMTPNLIAFSVLTGIVICAVSSKNKALRKWAVVWFIVMIPFGLIIFRYGIGMLIGIIG